MRKLLVGVLGLLAVVLLLVAAFLFVPTPLQKWAVQRGATLAAGRAVSFGEPFRLSAWPPLEITASDVRIANADWGTAPELARIGALEARLDLLAYWRDGRIQLDRLVVSQPQVNLEVDADGRRNWDLGGGDAPAGEPEDGAAGDGAIPAFVLGDVRIEDGVVAYEDRAQGTSRRAEAIGLTITQPGPDQPVALDGGLTLDGGQATLTGKVDRPQGAAAGERSPISVTVGLPGATASFTGEIETRGPAAAGTLDLQVAAPRDLLAWVGAAPPDGLPGALAVKGQIDVGSTRIALSGLQLQADAMTASGEVAVDLVDPPKVTTDLGLGRLDLTPYLGAPQSGDDASASAAPEGWPDTPLELPLPLPVDLDAKLRGEGVKAGKLEVGAFAAQVAADRQQLTATIDSLQAYGGGVTGTLRAEAATPPAYAVDLDVRDLGVLAASQALTGLSRIDGRGGARLALRTKGASVRQLVQDLGGEGRVSVQDGAVIGINIAGMLRQIMTLGLDRAATEQQRTDFAEAGASFRIEQGIVRTEDLHLNAPVLRLEGAGAVDLPRLTIDMRVTPKLASTLEGQNASGEPVFQAGIPFVIQGPYASPSVRFDLGGTLTGAIEGPEDVARLAADLAKSPQAVDALRKQFDLLKDLPAPAAGEALDALKGVIEGGKSGTEKKPPDTSDLGNAAKGLLKGLTGQ